MSVERFGIKEGRQISWKCFAWEDTWTFVVVEHSWVSLVAQLVKNPPAMRETWVDPWVWKSPWRRERLPTPVFWPGELHGLYSPWGRKESDMTEQLSLTYNISFRCAM